MKYLLFALLQGIIFSKNLWYLAFLFSQLLNHFLILKVNLTSALQSFIETPRNTTVQFGHEVMLKCSIKNQKGEVVWCKDDSFCTFGRKRNFTDSRLTIAGDESKGLKRFKKCLKFKFKNFIFKIGEHHLLIKNSSLVDDTKYQCQVTATDTEPAIKSDFAYLTVLGIFILQK